ncbi:MAG: Eco57I restriction-modification methylase domain-containing protein [Bacteroidia bacterium]|nr:Eco57I restriction-modification methylase domain-containing protein [Bacteroidia bacterium]
MLNDDGDFVGFDVVIGNPPYIRQEEFSDLKPYLKSRFEIFHSLADLLTYFVELSHNILSGNGTFQFIISGKFTRAGYGNLMRKYLSEKTEMTHFIDFGGKPVFDEATVDAAIIGFIKKQPRVESKIVYKEVLKEDNVALDFGNYIKINSTEFPTTALTEDVWSFDNPKWLSIIEKINKNGIPLSDWDITINFGIKTGYNEAFIIDEAKKNELIEADAKSAEIMKPLLRGRDIQKYVADDVVNWVINSHNGSKQKIKPVNIDEYPIIKKWLDSHWEKISERYDKGQTPYNLRNCAYLEDFEKPKLVWKRIGSILRFCYDESGAYCLDSTCIATGSKVKFLTAVLNSKICNKELFRLSPKTGTGDLIISVQALNPLRIPIPTNEQENEICTLLDKIIEFKNQNPSADTTDLENQIDQLVYNLYGLTEEEIKIVENG